MKIVQITDSHIGQESEIIRGVDVRKNYLRILEAVTACSPDLVIHTGDMCAFEGDAAIYRWISRVTRDQLKEIPFYAIPGNHDDSRMMAAEFRLPMHPEQGEVFYSIQSPYGRLLMADSARGRLSDIQLEWLKLSLQANNKHTVIFIHHPPCLCHVPYMDDNYALQDRKRVMDTIQGESNAEVFIFCGHYHVDKSIHLDNVDVFITPSSYFQIDASQKDFAVDHYRVGYRMIEITDEALITSVYYLT